MMISPSDLIAKLENNSKNNRYKVTVLATKKKRPLLKNSSVEQLIKIYNLMKKLRNKHNKPFKKLKIKKKKLNSLIKNDNY